MRSTFYIGAYLLDRDPVYFRALLNFLRTGRLSLDTGVNVDGVFAEAEFFQIQELIKLTDPASRPDFTRCKGYTLVALSAVEKKYWKDSPFLHNSILSKE